MRGRPNQRARRLSQRCWRVLGAGAARWPAALLIALLLLAGCGRVLAQPPSGPPPTPIALLPGQGTTGITDAPAGTWQGINGYTLLQEPSLTADPSNTDAAYLCSTRAAGAGSATQVVLEHTINGGITWQPLNVPEPHVASSCSVSVNPLNQLDLFLSLGFAASQTPAPGAGLYRSRDGGQSWQPLNQPGNGDQQINLTAPLVGLSDTLIAQTGAWNPAASSSDPHRLFLSQDNGQTWAPLDTPLVQQGLMVLTFAFAGIKLLAVTIPNTASEMSAPLKNASGGPHPELWEAPTLSSDWQPVAPLPVQVGDTTGLGAHLFNADASFGGLGILYYVDALSNTTITMSADGGTSWRVLPNLSTAGQFVPLLAGSNQFLYGYLLSNAPISSDQAAAEGVVWNVTIGGWQAVTPHLALSILLRVTPDFSGAPFGSWWALDLGGPPSLLRFASVSNQPGP
jgi:hypothetical protein